MSSNGNYAVSPLRGHGYVLLERGLRDVNIFKRPKEYSEYEAFIYLLENAAFETKTDFVNGLVVELQRGQLIASYRYLEEAWGWKKDRVAAFLKKLEKVGWVECTTDYKEISDTNQTAKKTHYNRRPTLIDILIYNALQRTENTPKNKNSDRPETEKPTAFIGETDKPKINQINHINNSKTHNPDNSDKTLMETFPDAISADSFVNVVPQKWHVMPMQDLGWNINKIEEELHAFWNRYSELGSNKKQKLEKRQNWYGVWKRWCNQHFRNKRLA